jgi:hypothetical protein
MTDQVEPVSSPESSESQICNEESYFYRSAECVRFNEEYRICFSIFWGGAELSSLNVFICLQGSKEAIAWYACALALQSTNEMLHQL